MTGAQAGRHAKKKNMKRAVRWGGGGLDVGARTKTAILHLCERIDFITHPGGGGGRGGGGAWNHQPTRKLVPHTNTGEFSATTQLPTRGKRKCLQVLDWLQYTTHTQHKGGGIGKTQHKAYIHTECAHVFFAKERQSRKRKRAKLSRNKLRGKRTKAQTDSKRRERTGGGTANRTETNRRGVGRGGRDTRTAADGRTRSKA